MNWLTQVLKGILRECGFQVVCLEATQWQMSKQPLTKALGTFVVDEIKLWQYYEFNKFTALLIMVGSWRSAQAS